MSEPVLAAHSLKQQPPSEWNDEAPEYGANADRINVHDATRGYSLRSIAVMPRQFPAD
jgi:hypothetical protein